MPKLYYKQGQCTITTSFRTWFWVVCLLLFWLFTGSLYSDLAYLQLLYQYQQINIIIKSYYSSCPRTLFLNTFPGIINYIIVLNRFVFSLVCALLVQMPSPASAINPIPPLVKD